MKTNLKNMHFIKSYGQNKIRFQIMAIFFVFLPYFCLKMATPEEALPMVLRPHFNIFGISGDRWVIVCDGP